MIGLPEARGGGLNGRPADPAINKIDTTIPRPSDESEQSTDRSPLRWPFVEQCRALMTATMIDRLVLRRLLVSIDLAEAMRRAVRAGRDPGGSG